MKTIVNDKNETIGKINDFIKERIFLLAFNGLKLDDSRGFTVLPGANSAALEKLHVYLHNAQAKAHSVTR